MCLYIMMLSQWPSRVCSWQGSLSLSLMGKHRREGPQGICQGQVTVEDTVALFHGIKGSRSEDEGSGDRGSLTPCPEDLECARLSHMPC